MKKTIRDCFVNFTLAALVIYLANGLAVNLVGEPMLAAGLEIGGAIVVAFMKGIILDKHRFSMSLTAEIFLIFGLTTGTFLALGADLVARGVAYYEFLALAVSFTIGLGINRISALVSKRMTSMSLSSW